MQQSGEQEPECAGSCRHVGTWPISPEQWEPLGYLRQGRNAQLVVLRFPWGNVWEAIDKGGQIDLTAEEKQQCIFTQGK